jgi:hypothetical protein
MVSSCRLFFFFLGFYVFRIAINGWDMNGAMYVIYIWNVNIPILFQSNYLMKLQVEFDYKILSHDW